MEFFIECSSCGESYDYTENVYSCERCGGRLDITYPYQEIANKIDPEELTRDSKKGLRKYLNLLPISSEDTLLSLGEGNTPLQKCNKLTDVVGIENLYAKNETINPTGTFKDRPASVGISRAIENGGNKVVAASDGNVAPATSAYANNGGLKSVIILPEYMQSTRIKQTIVYGSEVFIVEGGDVNDCIELSSELEEKYDYHHLSTAAPVNPYQMEGSKTIGFEICEQLDWEMPDWVVAPVGGGGLLTSNWKAFNEFYEFGLIDSLPKMVGVQAERCAPVVEAYNDGERKEIEKIRKDFTTIAVPIGVPYPLDGETALDAIFNSGGTAVSVRDEEIKEAQKMLAETESIVAEPAGATSLAGVRKLSKSGVIDRNESVVFEVTGTGLRELYDLSKNYKEPYHIKPEIENISEKISL